MEDKNINNNHDSGFKKISIEFPQSLLEFVGLNDYKIARRLDKSVDFNNIVSKDGDCLFETDSGELIHIEFQSSDNIYKKDLNRFLLYSSYYRMVENKDVISVIIYGKNIKDRGYFIDTGTLVYRPITVYLGDINADDILCGIKDKLYKGIRLQKSDVMLLTMIPEFTTPQDESYYVRESLEILDRLNVSTDLIDILGIFFNKEGEFAKMIKENKRLDYHIDLDKKIEYFKDNKELIFNEVLEKVKELFSDKVDKGGNPYINHLLYVANKQETIDGKIIGLLHDILEDTETTVEELIEWGLPNSIIDKIELLTRSKKVTYRDYINRIALLGSIDVVAVKLADLEHNMDITRVSGDDRDKIMNLINTRYKPAYDILSKKN